MKNTLFLFALITAILLYEFTEDNETSSATQQEQQEPMQKKEACGTIIIKGNDEKLIYKTRKKEETNDAVIMAVSDDQQYKLLGQDVKKETATFSLKILKNDDAPISMQVAVVKPASKNAKLILEDSEQNTIAVLKPNVLNAIKKGSSVKFIIGTNKQVESIHIEDAVATKFTPKESSGDLPNFGY